MQIERTLKSELIYEGRVFRVERLDIELEDGTRSIREIVRHGGAVGVIARKAAGGHILVRQYRKAVELPSLEIVAGTLEPGEDPAECARRELLEESGCTAASMRYLGKLYPSPGYVSEEIHIFLAVLNEGRAAQDPDEDERLEIVEMSHAQVEAAMWDGTIRDSKTLGAWTMYRLHAPEDFPR